MGLNEYRSELGLTLEETAAALGLGSKGYLSQLENGRASWPIRLALEVEVWSHGRVRAVDLVGPVDAALLRAAMARAAIQPEPVG